VVGGVGVENGGECWLLLNKVKVENLGYLTVVLQ
jgi:hypothetical protein